MVHYCVYLPCCKKVALAVYICHVTSAMMYLLVRFTSIYEYMLVFDSDFSRASVHSHALRFSIRASFGRRRAVNWPIWKAGMTIMDGQFFVGTI